MANLLTREGGERSRPCGCEDSGGEWLLPASPGPRLGKSPGLWRMSPGWAGSSEFCSLCCTGANKQVRTTQFFSVCGVGVPQGHAICESHSRGINKTVLLLESWTQTHPNLSPACGQRRVPELLVSPGLPKAPEVRSCICKTKSKAGEGNFRDSKEWGINKLLVVGFHRYVPLGLDRWVLTH